MPMPLNFRYSCALVIATIRVILFSPFAFLLNHIASKLPRCPFLFLVYDNTTFLAYRLAHFYIDNTGVALSPSTTAIRLR